MATALLATAAPTNAVEPPPDGIAAKPADGLNRRHRVGRQVGGSSFAQISYRLRTFGHVYLDVSMSGAPHGMLAVVPIRVNLDGQPAAG